MSGLAAIPYMDVRDGSPIDAARRFEGRARALADAARDTFGLASRIVAALAVPWTDRLSQSWLERTGNPYLGEINALAELLAIRGVHSLNLCFEWGCTSGVWPTSSAPILRRVMDWGFPLLGENLIVLNQRGAAGDFFNITWPGLAGSFQGLAPGRFAAAINQAPMRGHGKGGLGDWLANRRMVAGKSGLPPAHLLRHMFETARDYDAAKAMLCNSEIAVPAIFILSGTKSGEGCVIERTEESFRVRDMSAACVCAANHFESDMPGIWLARPIDSAGRSVCAKNFGEKNFGGDFSWFIPPVANVNSRLVFEADAQSGALALMGTAGEKPVTEIFRL